MSAAQKRIILTLAVLSLACFIVFCFPNAANSADAAMVRVFEPDEAEPLPYVLHMIQPYDTLKLSLYNFAYYNYYFYGFPHFAWSALVLLPLKWAGQLSNIPLVMLMLRQMVSFLPLLAAVWLLVYLQTGFKSWKAVPVFLLLLSLPAALENNLWWHPDGLAILMMALALFFLTRDNLRLGVHFYLCAAMCGLAAMTKGIGFFFFLAVALYLLTAWRRKQASLKRLALSAAGFLLVMGAAYFMSNPILVYGAERTRYFETMRDQSELLRQGYELRYATGLAAALPALYRYYGSLPFLLAGLGACIWGIVRGQKRLLNSLILAWVIPLSLFDFFFIHFKPQYWLPAALPLFSALVMVLPEKQDFLYFRSGQKSRRWFEAAARLALTALLLIQFVFFITADAARYQKQLQKGADSPALAFYDELQNALAPLPRQAFRVYYDPRMYVPETSGWVANTRYEVLTYPYIEDSKYDVLLIMQSRVNDYLNENAQAVNEDEMARARVFYGDVRADAVSGYRLVYKNEFGLAFVTDALYEQYFADENIVPDEEWPACRSCPR